MKPKVLTNQVLPEEIEKYIREHCELEKVGKVPREELLQMMNDVEGFLTSGGSIDDEFLNHAPNLKIVSNISVGYNSFNIEAMKKRNVIGTHTPSVLDDTVADLVLGLMISAARRIPELDHFVKSGQWTKIVGDEYFGVDVHHSTVGIIGMGRIGESIAKRCKFGFDMNVLYHSRSPKPDIESRVSMEYKGLNELLEESDFIVLITPLTDETYHLIGMPEFKKMKKSAIFINASRGATVDEEAMVEALKNGEIRAAGLDVFKKEPTDPDNPLLKLDNAVTVPHIGSATEKTRYDMAMTAAKDIVSALTGGQPENIVKELRN